MIPHEDLGRIDVVENHDGRIAIYTNRCISIKDDLPWGPSWRYQILTLIKFDNEKRRSNEVKLRAPNDQHIQVPKVRRSGASAD